MNEEDIKNLNEIIELCEAEINNNDKNVTAILDLTDLKSLRNLINGNRGLEALKNSCPAIPTTGIECDLKKELEEDYTSVYLKGVYDERDKWKSKIKEKIEEVNKSNGYSPVNKILIEQVLNSILKIGG